MRGNEVTFYKRKTISIAASRAVEDTPFLKDSVYTINGKKIGYLVYNHFSSGPTDNSNEYDNDLRSAFQYFASQQVNEFILDLRYNNGGLLSCAELLCTMLAPSSALGQELGYLEFNNRFNPQIVPFTLNSGLIGNGANLNLNTLYVLTSSQTASASEMVINCLDPYMDVVIIGGRQECRFQEFLQPRTDDNDESHRLQDIQFGREI